MKIDSRAGTQKKSTDAHSLSQIKIDRTGENYYIKIENYYNSENTQIKSRIENHISKFPIFTY